MRLLTKPPFAIALGITILLMSAQGLIACAVFPTAQGQEASKMQPLPRLEAIATLQDEGNYTECIRQAQQLVEQTSADVQTREISFKAIELKNTCQTLYAQQLAERGQYREAILEAGKLPRDSALPESLIQSWATRMNLTGKWWLCGVIGRATITDDSSLVEIYQSSMSSGDPAQQSYCIQISSSQPSFSGN